MDTFGGFLRERDIGRPLTNAAKVKRRRRVKVDFDGCGGDTGS